MIDLRWLSYNLVDKVPSWSAKRWAYQHLYLRSHRWRTFRRRIAIQRNYTCEMCHLFCGVYYDIHHTNYSNLGDESDHDVVLLCRACHAKKHGR